ncbi:cytochrome P450 [Aspergillus phoenicis ATCC 13157]|uniref:Cytochrome P450 n=1 Tax=Aspergillus phoenicis ATCC 13157 TaxID=1353007 RepID=A0A370P9A0_ASPPH|nr:cytochrome P450 [Aspergillus phoenicis ATCC 13157]
MALFFDLLDIAKEKGPLLAAAGISAHVFYWSRGERGAKEGRAWVYANLIVNTLALLTTINNHGSWTSIYAWVLGISTVFVLNICFYFSLFTSVLTYRAFFHRLHHFPGPFSLKLSKFVTGYENLEKNRNFERVWNLHKQYGDIIRTGPQELSILSAEAIDVIYGPSSKCTRGPWYDRLKGSGDFTHDYAVFHMRDPAVHSQRRKALWDKVFSGRALKSYQPMVIRTTEQFLDAVAQRVNQPLSVPSTMSLLSYDLMGVVGWGHSFNNIETWELNPSLHFIKNMRAGQHVMVHTPWLISLLMSLPGAGSAIRDYGNWIQDRIQEKRQQEERNEVPGEDIMTRMLPSMRDLSKKALYSEGELLVIAGGDTSSVTMSVIIYHLARNQFLQRKLQAELDSAAAKRQKDSVPPTDSPEDTYYRSISSLPYLNGCVSEALRIQPPVHGGIQRKTPPEGIHIPNGKGTPTFIPGDTLVSVPILPVQNDPRYYRNPEAYVPERWTDEKPDWIMNRAAYFPFVGGAYSCVGKGLAYIELRVVVAMLFGRFNVRLAEGEDGRRFREETRDTFVASLGEFRVVFSERGE